MIILGSEQSEVLNSRLRNRQEEILDVDSWIVIRGKMSRAEIPSDKRQKTRPEKPFQWVEFAKNIPAGLESMGFHGRDPQLLGIPGMVRAY